MRLKHKIWIHLRIQNSWTYLAVDPTVGYEVGNALGSTETMAVGLALGLADGLRSMKHMKIILQQIVATYWYP